jgi:heat shock protein HslJ
MPARFASALLAVLMALAACDGAPPPDVSGPGHPATLAGTAWRVVGVDGREPVVGKVPTVMFEISTVSGSGGCNFFSGSYRYDPGTGRIGFDRIGMTARACAEPLANAFETRFSEAFVQADLAFLDTQGRLSLNGPGGAIVLEPDPQRAVEG